MRRATPSGRGLVAVAFLALCALSALCLGCAGFHPALTCPSKGGPTWVQISTPHFEVYTDADKDAAREHARDLEVHVSALATVLGVPEATLASKLDVIWFSRAADYVALRGASRLAEGLYRFRSDLDLEPRPFIVAFREAPGAMWTIQHELTHRLLRPWMPRLPVWLDEGLAEYYATLSVTDRQAFLGELSPRERFAEVPNALRANGHTIIPCDWAPPLPALLAMDRDTFYGYTHGDFSHLPARYLASARLVHYFLHGPNVGDRLRFATVWQAIGRGAPAQQAFAAAWSVAAQAELEAAYRAYLQTGVLPTIDERRFAVPLSPPNAERTLSDVEVHLLWARIAAFNEGITTPASEALTEALREAPGEPEPHYRRAVFFLRIKNLEGADRELTQALAKRPDDPRYLLGRVALWTQQIGSREPTEAESSQIEGIVTHLAQVATSATELLVASQGYHALGREEESFDLIVRAVARDPTCSVCNEYHAETLLARGRTEEALRAVDRAMTFLPERAGDGQLRRLRMAIEARQASAPPTPAPAP